MPIEITLGATAICAGILWALAEIWWWMDERDAYRLEPRCVVAAEEQVVRDEAVWFHPSTLHPSLPPRWPLE